MAKVTQKYVLEVTAQGLKEVVREIKALRGDMAKVQSSTGKAAGGVDNLGRAADRYSKKAKGVGQLTNNQTKAFSKMSQGMSGTLVPAYATVAATVFALTAAFGALKRAADFEILINASEKLSERTGRSLTSLASDMKEITGNAISMKEALTNASLAASAGFDNSTIKELTQVSKDASVALGRNMTDAMDRVFKGAIKAEPELLDELGIILRLDPATRKYAASLGKAVKDLTTFEKQQAVVNEVLEQGKEKFGILGDIDPNPYTQLSSAFADIAQKILVLVSSPLTGFFSFLAENTTVLTGALLLFANTVIQRALPALTELGINAENNILKVFQNIEKELTRKTATAEWVEDFKGGLGDVAQAAEYGAQAIRTNLIDLDLPEGVSEQILKNWEGVDKAIDKPAAAMEAYTKTTQLLQEEQAFLENTMDTSSEAYKEMSGNLDHASAANEAWTETNDIATGAATKHRSAIDSLSSSFKTLKANIGILAGAGASGFGAGISGGLTGLVGNIKSFNAGLKLADKSGRVATATMRGLAVSIFSVSAAMGAMVSLVPIIGQITVLFGILGTGISKLFAIFRDNNDEIVALNEAYDDQEDSLKSLTKSTLYYENNLKDLPDTLDNVTKKLESQSNILTTMAGDFDNIVNAQAKLGGFSGLDEFLDIFGFGKLDKLKDELIPEQINILEGLGIAGVQEDLNVLIAEFGPISELSGDKALKFASKLNVIQKAARDVSQELKTTNKAFVDTLAALDKSVTALTTPKKLTDLEAVFIGLQSTVAQIDLTKIQQTSDILVNLSDAAKAEFGISFEVDQMTKFIVEVERAQKGLVILAGEVKVTDTELSKLVTTTKRGHKGLTTLASAEAYLLTALNEKGVKYRELISLQDQQSAVTKLYNDYLKEQTDLLEKLNEVALASLKERVIILQNLVNAERKYGLEIFRTKALLKQPNLTGEEQLHLIDRQINAQLSLNNAERDRYQAQYNSAKVSLGKIGALTADNAVAHAKYSTAKLNADKALASSQNKSAEIYLSKLKQIDKVLEKTLERERLGIRVDTSSATIFDQLEDAARAAGIALGKTDKELDKFIQKYTTNKVLDSYIKGLGKIQTVAQGDTNAQAEAERLAILGVSEKFLKERGVLLSGHIEQENIINQLLLTREENRINAALVTEVEGDKRYNLEARLKQITDERLASENKLNSTRQERLDKLEQELKNENALSAINLKYASSSSQFAQKELAWELKKQELLNTGNKFTDTQLAKAKKLAGIEFDRLKKIEAIQKVTQDISSAATGISAFSSAIEEMRETLEALGEEDGIAKFQAGLLAINKITQEIGNKPAKSLSDMSIIASNLGENLKKGKEEAKLQNIEFDGTAMKLDAAGQMAGAMAGAFEKGTAASKIFNVAQSAIALSSAVIAVLEQAKGDPYTAFARQAAMAAAAAGLLAQIGISFGGSGGSGGSGTSAEAQKEAYLGSFGAQGVQGVDLQNNSLVESMDSLVAIDTKLFSSLRDLQLAIIRLRKSFDQVGAAIFKQSGSFSAGNILDQFGVTFGTDFDPGFFGDTTTTSSLLNAGIQFGATVEFISGELVGQINDAKSFLVQQITETDSGFLGFGGGTDIDIVTRLKDLAPEVNTSLTKALDDTLDVIARLFGEFGAGIVDTSKFFNNLDTIIIDTTKLDLTDKSAQEQSAVVGAFFSNLTNDIIKSVSPWLVNFSQAGEELTDTLVRITEELAITQASFETIGTTLAEMVDLVLDPTQETPQKLAQAQYDLFIAQGTPLFERQEVIESALYNLVDSTGNFLALTSAQITELFGEEEQQARIYAQRSSGDFSTGNSVRAYIDYWNELADVLWAIEDLRTNIVQLTQASLVAWDVALKENFKDAAEYQKLFEKFSETIFSSDELAQIAEENAKANLALGVEKLDSLVSEYVLPTSLTSEINAEEFRLIFDYLKEIGAFAPTWDPATGDIITSGADLLATVVKVGAAIGLVEDAVQEVDEAINTFARDIQRQIDLFGLLGKELDNLQLVHEYEDALEQAREAGEGIILVEQLYGLKRLAIAKQYNQEIVDQLDTAFDSIADSMLNVVKSFGGWKEIVYQGLKIDKMTTRLISGLGSLATSIDFTAFTDAAVDMQEALDFDTTFGNLVKFNEEEANSIEEQIQLVEDLRAAVIDRYNVEENAVNGLKQLTLDIVGYLKELRVGDLSPLTNAQQLAEAQSQFNENMQNIFSTDTQVSESARADLLSSASTLLEKAGEFWAIGPAYQEIYNNVVSSLENLDSDIADKLGLSDTALAITEQTDALTSLQLQTIEQLQVLDTVLTTLQTENNQLFQSEIEGIMLTFTGELIGVGTSITTKLQLLNDTTWEPIRNILAGMNTFASGSLEVPFDQIAQIHKGEMVVPAQQAEVIRDNIAANDSFSTVNNTSTTTINNTDVVQAIQTLTQVLATSQEDLLDQGDQIRKATLSTQPIKQVSTLRGRI